MISKICLCLLFLFSSISRILSPKPDPSIFQSQGIAGYVYRVSGNQMPSPNRKSQTPQGTRATLFFYELTNLSQVRRLANSAFYLSIQTKLVKMTESDTSGYFNVQLPPGRYSIFTKKDTLFYANRFDSNNNILPVQVESRKITRVEIRVDYDASY